MKSDWVSGNQIAGCNDNCDMPSFEAIGPFKQKLQGEEWGRVCPLRTYQFAEKPSLFKVNTVIR